MKTHLCEGTCADPSYHTCVAVIEDPTGRSAFRWCDRQATSIRRFDYEPRPGEIYHDIAVYECDEHIGTAI